MDPRNAPQPGPRPSPRPALQSAPVAVAVGAGSAPVVDAQTIPTGLPAQPPSPTEAIPAQRVVSQQPAALWPVTQKPVTPRPVAPPPVAPQAHAPQPVVEPSVAAVPVELPPVPGAPVAATGKRRRSRWVWALVVLVVLAGGAYAGWTVLQGRSTVTAGTPVDRVQAGQPATSASGLEFTISAPKQYQPSNALLLDKGDTAYEATMTIVNDSGDTVVASSIAVSASVGGKDAPQIFDQSFLATQQIAVGQKLDVPFRFRVPQGVTGPVQITVTESGVPTVVASGTL